MTNKERDKHTKVYSYKQNNSLTVEQGNIQTEKQTDKFHFLIDYIWDKNCNRVKCSIHQNIYSVFYTIFSANLFLN